MLQASDILAGPILRRVEGDLVSVWVALTKPARVEIEVYRGQGAAGSFGPAVARRATVSPTDIHTVAAGAALHVAVSIWEPVGAAGLDLGQVYSYDLLITADGGETARLGDLGLLADHPGPPAWLALGYQQGWLPSFAVVPANVADLKFAQGSCRASAGSGRDALPPLDDVIRASLTDGSQRLHMLWLTGDQIYADEVAAEQLEMLQRLSNRLLGGSPDAGVETIAVDLPALEGDGGGAAEVKDFPVDVTHLPPGRRGHLLNDIAGFTSTSTDSHVMGFGEYVALYLTGWSTMSWEWDPRAVLRARKPAFEAYVDKAGGDEFRFETRLSAPGGKEKGKGLEGMVPYHAAWRLVPAKYRAIDALLTANDRNAAWGQGAEGGDSDRYFKWEMFWGPDPDNPPVPPGDERPADVPASTVRTAAERRRLARLLTPSWYAGRRYFNVNYTPVKDQMASPGARKLKTTADAVYNRVHRLDWFFKEVPRVRRLLANVPTYMVFDDHEITDDWNISPKWARATRASALGRAVIRNGLAACTLCQNWGNDPRAFRPGTIGRRVLDNIERMFAGATPAHPGPNDAAAEELERLFDLRPPTPNDQRMTWHFRMVGPGFEVLTLDSRTWRGFEPTGNDATRARFSPDATATLLTDEAMRLQVPEQPALGVNPDGVCLVIAAAPFLGYPVVESIVQPMMNLHDIVKAEKPGPPFVRWEKSFAVGRVARDPENWGFTPSLFEAMLARLATRRRVLFLSGDVHYAYTLAMAYWRMGPGWTPLEATRFVQLTASSFRAQRDDLSPLIAIDLAQQLGKLSSAAERYGWHRGRVGTPEAAPPLVPGAVAFGPHLSGLLEEDPIVVSPTGVPGTATYVRGPEWAWRTRLEDDARPDTERLGTLRPPPFSNASEIDRVRSVAERHVWQAQNAMPRGWQWWTNFTTVEFTKGADGKAVAVRHKIYGYDPQGIEPTMRPFIVAEVPLAVLEPPPSQPPPGGPHP